MVAANLELENLPKRIGLIAGNGDFPREFIEQARLSGREVFVVGFLGEVESDIPSRAAAFCAVKVGQVGKLISFFKSHRISHLAMVGGVKKTKLLVNFLPDFRLVKILTRARSTQDDRVLREFVAELEGEGITTFAPAVVLKVSKCQPGILCGSEPSAEEMADVRIGFEMARAIGRLEIGQSVAVKSGVVVAVEAVEGTDAMIRRAGALGAKGFVVVKASKPQQDLRLDPPSIGPKTIEELAAAGGRVLAIEAEKTLILKPLETTAQAKSAGISIVALSAAEITAKT